MGFGPIAPALLTEPAAAYHARAKEYLTSHRLADFRRCPRLYRWKQIGLARDEDRPSYLLGRAAHTLILEGRDKFLAEYAVGGGPINKATGKPYKSDSQAYQQWARAQGRPVISEEDAGHIEQLAAGVMSHDLARQLLVLGLAEAVLRTRWRGVNCQARIDWFTHMEGAAIVDLKTCEDLDRFEADARRYGYAHQMAFYRSICAAAAEVDPLDVRVHMIAVEKNEPFRCGVWRVGEAVLAAAQKENEAAIERLKHCERTGIWPTGYEDLRTFDGT